MLSALYASPNDAYRATRVFKHLEKGINKNVFKASQNSDDDSSSEPKYFSCIVELTAPDALDELREMGCVIFGHRDELALVCVPEDLEDEFYNHPGLGEIQSAQTAVNSCDVLREFTGVTNVYNQYDFGFTGEGIVLGLSDIGFDSRHASFANNVKRFSYYNDLTGKHFRLENPDDIYNQYTDNPEETHAAMCANILAGSKEASPYHGIAYNSDLVVATSGLYDCGILAGIDEVIDYAKQVGKPAVVSLSIATYTGPHDGKDLICRYLSKQAEEAFIAVASGNEGEVTNSIYHKFTSEQPEIMAALRPRGLRTSLQGRTDVWVCDESPISFTLEIWDNINKKTVYSRQITSGQNSDDTETIIFTDNDPEGLGQFYHGGGIAIASGVHPYSGRNSILIYYVLEPNTEDSFTFFPVIKLKAEEGTEIEMFTDSSRTIFNWENKYGFTRGTDDMCVNNFACTPNVTCVGAFTARQTFTLDNGYTYKVNDSYPYNEVTPFSGFASRLSDGRTLPHIVAPGVGIVTAVNSYSNPENGYSVVDSKGHTSFWRADDGTSFAAPAVAAIAALWLEANSDLTPAQIREIAMQTANKDFAKSDHPKAGAGYIDALQGIKKALEMASLDNNVSVSNPTIVIYPDGRNIVALSSAGSVDLEIFTPQGTKAPSENLTPGIYICRASVNNFTETKSILIK